MLFFSLCVTLTLIASTTTCSVPLSHDDAMMLDEDAFDAYAPDADEITTNCAHLRNAVKMSLPKELKKALTKGDDDVGICRVSALLACSYHCDTYERLAARRILQNEPMPAMSLVALTICGYVSSAA